MKNATIVAGILVAVTLTSAANGAILVSGIILGAKAQEDADKKKAQNDR